MGLGRCKHVMQHPSDRNFCPRRINASRQDERENISSFHASLITLAAFSAGSLRAVCLLVFSISLTASYTTVHQSYACTLQRWDTSPRHQCPLVKITCERFTGAFRMVCSPHRRAEDPSLFLSLLLEAIQTSAPHINNFHFFTHSITAPPPTAPPPQTPSFWRAPYPVPARPTGRSVTRRSEVAAAQGRGFKGRGEEEWWGVGRGVRGSAPRPGPWHLATLLSLPISLQLLRHLLNTRLLSKAGHRVMTTSLWPNVARPSLGLHLKRKRPKLRCSKKFHSLTGRPGFKILCPRTFQPA